MPEKKHDKLFLGQKPRALAGGASKKVRLAYSARKGVAFPAFRPLDRTGKIARQEFLSSKRAYASGLKTTLRRMGLEPEMQKAILRVGSLPFAFAWMSHGPMVRPKDGAGIEGFSFSEPISIEKARSLPKIVFSPAYFVVHTDPTHPRSRAFVEGLNKLVKSIPSALIFEEGRNMHQLLCPSTRNFLHFELSPGEIDKNVAKSRNFIKEFDNFVRRFKRKSR